MTVALANHSVIKAIWYWGSAEVRTKHQHIDHGSDFVEGQGTAPPERRILLTIPRIKNRPSPTKYNHLHHCYLTFHHRAVSTSSTPAPVLWKHWGSSARRMMKEKTGLSLTPHSWKRCGEMLSSGRVSGFLLHKKTEGGRINDGYKKGGESCRYLLIQHQHVNNCWM